MNLMIQKMKVNYYQWHLHYVKQQLIQLFKATHDRKIIKQIRTIQKEQKNSRKVNK